MARVTSEMRDGWVKEAILVLDSAAPSRHFWSRWMDRAMAPHANQMTQRPGPIPANDVAPDEDSEAEAPTARDESGAEVQVLHFD